MNPNDITRTTHTFTAEQIDDLAKHIRLVISAAKCQEKLSDEELDAARSALRRIVEQAKECV